MRVCTAVVRALVVLTVVLREVLVPDVAACHAGAVGHRRHKSAAAAAAALHMINTL